VCTLCSFVVKLTKLKKMSENEVLKLSDKNVVPTDEFVFSVIGEKKEFWQSIIGYAASNYKEVSGSWNYYNDGKQWLYKLLQKKKTLLWVGLLIDSFRVTFYFGDKAEPLIFSSDIPEELKDSFRTGKRYGAIRAITIVISSGSDVDYVKKLIDIKVKMK
jgi:hypothetical protein